METLNLLPIVLVMLLIIVLVIFHDLYKLRQFSNSLNKKKSNESFFKYIFRPSKERYNER